MQGETRRGPDSPQETIQPDQSTALTPSRSRRRRRARLQLRFGVRLGRLRVPFLNDVHKGIKLLDFVEPYHSLLVVVINADSICHVLGPLRHDPQLFFVLAEGRPRVRGQKTQGGINSNSTRYRVFDNHSYETRMVV